MKKQDPRKGTINRREFLCESAVVAAGLAVGIRSSQGAEAGKKPLNFNEDMAYRRLGKTGLMVSSVCLGGHWKRLNVVVEGVFKGEGWLSVDVKNRDFARNRYDVVSRCIEKGMNYIDACTGPEVLAYSQALKGRRDQMYLGYSWYEKEARFDKFRTAATLLKSLDEGLKAAGLDYVDLWRITCNEQGGTHTFNESEEIVAALAQAKKQGKARFTGVSSHDRPWLKMMIEQHPDQMEVVVTPYTAKSKVLPTDSLFDAVKKCDVGVFGIKPFAGTSLFKGDSSPASADAGEDDRRARLAIRNILANPAITAPIPGLITAQQVDNATEAVKELKVMGKLNRQELAELHQANEETWARLPHDYQWLKHWEYV
jgi:aryl-alcohol dehydrogenase-like predicted oxidoreductase